MTMVKGVTLTIIIILFALIDFGLNTLFYSHGGKMWKENLSTFQHFDIYHDILDIWVMGVMRAALLLGFGIGILSKHVKLKSVKIYKNIMIMFCLLSYTYLMIKLLIMSEKIIKWNNRPYFWCQFIWTLSAIILTYVLIHLKVKQINNYHIKKSHMKKRTTRDTHPEPVIQGKSLFVASSQTSNKTGNETSLSPVSSSPESNEGKIKNSFTYKDNSYQNRIDDHNLVMNIEEGNGHKGKSLFDNSTTNNIRGINVQSPDNKADTQNIKTKNEYNKMGLAESGSESDNQNIEDNTDSTFLPPSTKLLITPMMHIFKYAKHDYFLYIFAFIFLFLAAVADIFQPFYMGQVIDAIVIAKSYKQFSRAIIIMSIISVLSAFAAGLRGCFFTICISRLNIRIRKTLFASLLHQDPAFFDETKTGDLTSRLSADTSTLSDLIGLNLNVFLRSIVKGAGVCIFMFTISWQLSMITVLALPLFSYLSKVYGKFYEKLSERTQTSLAKSNDTAQETLSSIKTVKSFAGENSEILRYARDLKRTYRLMKRGAFLFAGYMWSSKAYELAILIIILYYGGHLVLTQRISGGSFVSFLLYQLQLGEAIASIGNVFTGLMQAIGSSKKVFELIERVPPFDMQSGHYIPEVFRGKITFSHVYFSYPTRKNTPALKDVSFNVNPGEIVALVGPSGGGKSSCIALLQNFYPPDKGRVLIDDIPVSDYDHTYLHQKMALVSQEPTLFSRSIRDNISYPYSRRILSQIMSLSSALTEKLASLQGLLKLKGTTGGAAPDQDGCPSRSSGLGGSSSGGSVTSSPAKAAKKSRDIGDEREEDYLIDAEDLKLLLNRGGSRRPPDSRQTKSVAAAADASFGDLGSKLGGIFADPSYDASYKNMLKEGSGTTNRLSKFFECCRRRRRTGTDPSSRDDDDGGGIRAPASSKCEPASFRAQCLSGNEPQQQPEDPKVVEAAQLSNAHTFITGAMGGYGINIGERGSQLSGGQKQRIALARALVRDPAIILLDEATSALDAESEYLVQEAITKNLKGKTVIIIAHRLSTVQSANRIIVLENGQVAEQGTHAQLLAKGGVYTNLVQRQLQGYNNSSSDDELDNTEPDGGKSRPSRTDGGKGEESDMNSDKAYADKVYTEKGLPTTSPSPHPTMAADNEPLPHHSRSSLSSSSTIPHGPPHLASSRFISIGISSPESEEDHNMVQRQDPSLT